MNLSCNAIQDMVALYTDKSLSDATLLEVEEHLKSCKECRTFYNEYKHSIATSLPADNDDIDAEAPQYTQLAKKVRRKNIFESALCFFGIALAFLVSAFSIIHNHSKRKKSK